MEASLPGATWAVRRDSTTAGSSISSAEICDIDQAAEPDVDSFRKHVNELLRQHQCAVHKAIDHLLVNHCMHLPLGRDERQQQQVVPGVPGQQPPTLERDATTFPEEQTPSSPPWTQRAATTSLAFKNLKAPSSASQLAGLIPSATTEEEDKPNQRKRHRSSHGNGCKCGLVQRRLLPIVEHSFFEMASAVLILLNVAVIGWETQHRAELASTEKDKGDWKANWHFYAIECFFTFMFTLELLMRALAQPAAFMGKKERNWNILDSIIVAASIAEVFAAGNAAQGNIAPALVFFLSKASIFKSIRLLRLIKAVDALRKWAAFRELRIMVASLIGGLVSLMWAMVIVSTMCFMFAVYFTEGATEYMWANGVQATGETEQLRRYYGDLLRTMASLYQAITGGDSWGNTVQALHLLSWEYTGVFYVFITFAFWALINVITALFVDSTLQRSAGDREFVVHAQMQGRTEFIEQMEEIFDELDVNNSGSISAAELEIHLSDPEAVAYFSSLNLNVRQVKRLFNLIDVNNSGTIERDEFIHGCFHLKGEAKNLDIAIIQHELQWIREMVVHLGEHFDRCFAKVSMQQTLQAPGLLSTL